MPSVLTRLPSAWCTLAYSACPLWVKPTLTQAEWAPARQCGAGVVAVAERRDHEVAGRERGDLAADLLDHADHLVPDGVARRDVVLAAVGPQVRAADAAGGHLDDGVGGRVDGGLRALLEADVAGCVDGGGAHDTHAAMCGAISYLRYSRAVTEDYLARIGNLIRDARKHRGWTQQQLADVLGTSQSAVNRIERGHQNLSLEMIARIGEALDSPHRQHRPGPDPPAGHRAHDAARLDRGEDLQERRRRPAVRLPAQPRAYDAAPGRPDRGGQPAARGARQHRREARAGSTTGNDLEIIPPPNLDLAASTRSRPVVPARSSCSSAR